MHDQKTIVNADVENVDKTMEESIESLKARISELESANNKLKSDVGIWQHLYSEEKDKQKKQTELTKTLMAYVAAVL